MEPIVNRRFTSNIVFRYYNDYEKAISFFEEVLELSLVMDQGFARVYQINDTSFIGCVRKSSGSIELGKEDRTLVSFNTRSVKDEYLRCKALNVPNLTNLKVIEQIPLESFFFTDYEGYDYEIQQFLKNDDLELF